MLNYDERHGVTYEKRWIVQMAALVLLLPSLTCCVSAEKLMDETSAQAFRSKFFLEEPQRESAQPLREVQENRSETGTILHMPQRAPEKILATEDVGQAIEEVRHLMSNYSVGDTEVSEVSFGGNSYGKDETATGTLMAQGDHVNVWCIAQSNGSQGTVTAMEYTAMAEKIDAIYAVMTSEFGPHAGVQFDTVYSNLPVVGDIGNDGKINVLLYDIYGDGTNSIYSGYTAGYFAAGNQYTSNRLGCVTDAIHMDIGTNHGYRGLQTGDGQGFFGTIAHEFQYMLFFMYCDWKIDGNGQSLTWFNESLSGLTDMYYVTGDRNQGQIASDSKMVLANQNSYANGSYYGDFLNFNNSFKNYGMGYLFSSMMQQKTEGSYGKDIYDFFKTIEMRQYSDADATELIGEALKSVLGLERRPISLL